jgi:pyruvate,orthophosphate dikinase
MTKWVYLFSEGNAKMRDLLGGKGAGLAEMANAGLPVPPGFTITTEASNEYFKRGKQFPPGMWEQTLEALKVVEKQTGKTLGDPNNPLLVSVRSGAKMSMPGMMDTVLNLGLNDETVVGLARLTNNERFAYDAYRRFISMFGRIVMGIDGARFDRILDAYKERTAGKKDTDLTAEMLKDTVADFKTLYEHELGQTFPQDPYEQLRLAIAAVFSSWMGRRAVDYRNFHKIPHTLGTGVNIQTMVFGNMGDDSGTGVAFTRDPRTGEETLYGEYLQNAQGEDVVAGIRTPKRIVQLSEDMPQVYQQFVEIARRLEQHYRDVQDLEFTIERGKLWMLQTRTGKRTAAAAVKIAVDMVNEKLITKEEAVQRVEPAQVYQLLLPRFDEADKQRAAEEGALLGTGLNASPGAASGVAIFDPDTAQAFGQEGKAVILVRPETSPDDVHGMLEAKGILTQHGGATSHAAVVARGLGKPCVAGAESIRVEARQFTADSVVVREGDLISIDGATGEIFRGAIKTVEPDLGKEHDLKQVLAWADEFRRLQVWANADYPRDARVARELGAQGIGLTRTEHMFFEEDRLPIVQRMILAHNDQARQAPLDELLPIQRQDFEGLFRVMDGLPVIIRLIDPPLHEFLPSYEELQEEIAELKYELRDAKTLRETTEKLAAIREKEELLGNVAAMREANPMLGLRGTRLGIIFPQITEMQVRAIFEAAVNVTEEGIDVHPEVMIPLVGHINELRRQREQLEPVARQVMAERHVQIDYKFGTMIEVPRAALTADEIATDAQFFSFGTNDLTQMTFGISRDDAEGKFLLKYVEEKLLPDNPFQVLDREGVGKLMQMAVELGRKQRPDLEIGICGEHGGDPSSIHFANQIGLNYVSASPYRVPVARLAAAQATLEEKDRDK